MNYFLFTIDNEDGDAALILFPVFVSILIIIGMGAAEFANYFVTAQRVAYLARESSNLAITKCWDIIYQEQNDLKAGRPYEGKTEKCLNDPNLPNGIFDVEDEVLDLGKDLIKTFNKQGVVKIHIWIKKVNPTNPDEPFVNLNFTRGEDQTFSQDPLIVFYKTPSSYFDENDHIHNKTSEEKKAEAQDIANEFHRIAIAESYYTYVPITPLNKIMGLDLPDPVREISIF